MTRAHRRYIAGEMALGAVINMVLSGAFVFLVFGGRADAPVAGWVGVAADAVPQSFMIALMSCIVPTVLTRRRLALGAVAPLAGRSRLPRSVSLRAMLVAVIVAIVAGAVQAALLPITGDRWSFATILSFKLIYGAVLGACVAGYAVRAALGDRIEIDGRKPD